MKKQTNNKTPQQFKVIILKNVLVSLTNHNSNSTRLSLKGKLHLATS